MASNPLNASVLPAVCGSLSSTGCSKCSKEGISRFLVGFSPLSLCCPTALQMWLSPAPREVFSPCQGQVGTSMAWFGFRIRTYVLYFYFFYKTSSEHSLVLQMRPKGLSPGVQESPWASQLVFGILLGYPMLQFHQWDHPLSLLTPAHHPSHNIIHNWCWCIAY